MKKNIYRVLSAVAVILCLWVIFSYSGQSAQTSLSSSGGIIEAIARFFNNDFDFMTAEQRAELIESWQIVVRKTAHFCEYAALGFLTANALCTYSLSKTLKAIIPIGFCVLTAVADEIQQSFIPGRAGMVSDVLLDSLGAVFGALCFALLLWIIKKIKDKRNLRKNDTQT